MLKQSIQRVIREFMGIVKVLLQGAHILVTGNLDDLVHRFASGDGRGDKSAAQTVATDIEVIDSLTGAPLDHQVDTLRPQRVWCELAPAIHPPKERPFIDPALLEPVANRCNRAIVLAGDKGDLGLMELMLAWFEAKPDPLPHKIEVTHLDSGRFRAA